jgi:hypothetical protein
VPQRVGARRASRRRLALSALLSRQQITEMPAQAGPAAALIAALGGIGTSGAKQRFGAGKTAGLGFLGCLWLSLVDWGGRSLPPFRFQEREKSAYGFLVGQFLQERTFLVS